MSLSTQAVTSLSFRPRHRLLLSSDFSAVFDQVDIRIAKGPYLLLCRKNQLDHPRLGLVIRKKFLKRAVDRNALKRMARENFRVRQQQLGNLDIIFMNRSAQQKHTPDACKQMVAELFESLTQHNV